MSIETRVYIRPSNYLRCLGAGICLCIIIAALLVALDQGFQAAAISRLQIAAGLVALACIGGWKIISTNTCFRIDISANAELGLTQYEGLPGAPQSVEPVLPLDAESGARHKARPGIGQKVRLLPHSTLWPGLLILRLAPLTEVAATAPVTVVVLPDSVTSNDFRELSVACRWIAAHNHRIGNKNG